MGRPRDCHTELSKSDREGKILYDIFHMWNLKNDTNELTKQKETHTLNIFNLWLPVHTAVFKMDNQQGPTA